MKKYSCMPINHKKYSCYGLKKNSYKEFDKEKKFLRLKNSSPTPHPHNFTNGLHLRADNPTHPLLNPSFFFFPLVCPRSYPWRELITCTSSSSFTTFFLTQLHTYFDHAVYHLFIPLHLHVWLTDSPKMRKSGTPIRHVFVRNFRTGISQ